MADVNYSTFLPQVLPYAVGAPEPTAITAIRNATIEFLRNTHFLQASLTPISVVADTAEYQVTVPTDYELTSVRALYFDHVRLSPVSELEVRHDHRDNQKATPSAFFMKSDNTLVLHRTPDVNGTLTGTIAICPTIRSTGVDALIADKFLEDISAGALSRLLMVPGEPFYDPQLAAFHKKHFASAVANAKALKNKSLVGAPLQVQFGHW